MGAAMPAEKALNFGPSAKRLLARMRAQRSQLALVVLLAGGSVTLAVIGPRLLGHATNVIFAGFIGKRLPSDITLQQAVAHARATGHGDYANLLVRSHAVPGHGIDFTSLGNVLLVAVCVYLAAAALSWIQAFLLNGVVQSTVRQLRADVDAKLNRLPLNYVDSQPRGELLSRVTNDIDNIGQSLQQTLSQLLTSVLTVIGVLTMMLLISWLLALIALVTVPVSIAVTKAMAASSLSGETPASSTARSRRRSRATSWCGCSAAARRPRPGSPRRTRRSIRPASARSSSAASSCRR
jgi:ATP-binding cassette subfamily B protein